MPYQNPDRQWNRQANCRGVPTRVFFPDEGRGAHFSWKPARELCDACPVRSQCLTAALQEELPSERNGMRGGMTPDERSQYVRQSKRQSKCELCGEPLEKTWHKQKFHPDCASVARVQRQNDYYERRGRWVRDRRSA